MIAQYENSRPMAALIAVLLAAANLQFTIVASQRLLRGIPVIWTGSDLHVQSWWLPFIAAILCAACLLSAYFLWRLHRYSWMILGVAWGGVAALWLWLSFALGHATLRTTGGAVAFACGVAWATVRLRVVTRSIAP
jgi:hypothetical protein